MDLLGMKIHLEEITLSDGLPVWDIVGDGIQISLIATREEEASEHMFELAEVLAKIAGGCEVTETTRRRS